LSRILVIDDDVEICTITKRFLLLDGHEVDTAENSAVGLKMAGLNQYDLVITDIYPDCEGFLKKYSLQTASSTITKLTMFFSVSAA